MQHSDDTGPMVNRVNNPVAATFAPMEQLAKRPIFGRWRTSGGVLVQSA